MVDLDIIERIEKSTKWGNDLVIVEKPNRNLNIYLDLRPLNNTVRREVLHFPTAKELFLQMPGVCFFSKTRCVFGILANKRR